MRRYVLITAAANVLFGLIPVYWKFLDAIPAGYILGQRLVWSVPFALLIVALSGNLPLLKAAAKNRRAMALTALAGVVITGNWYLYIWAVNAGMVMETSMAYFIAPLVVFLLSATVFREKAAANEIAAVALAAAGILIYTVWMGIVPLVALGLAVSFSVYGAFKKAAGLEPAVSLTLEMTVILPFALIYLAFTSFGPGGALGGLSVAEILLLIGTGVVSAVPLWLYSFGVKGLPFSLVGFLQYIWPTTSLVLSVAAFHEALTLPKLICFLFIWAGLAVFSVPKLLASRQTRRPRRSSKAWFFPE